MTTLTETTCPGCGLQMPARPGLICDGYYNASSERWGVAFVNLDR